MAYSLSPQLSPALGAGSMQQGSPHFAASPAPQQLTRRDKRRHALADRLNDLTVKFSQKRDGYFRTELQLLQVEMNLILHADPYQNKPLEDTGDHIAEAIERTLSGPGYAGVNARQLQRNIEAQNLPNAGRWYAKFVEEVNNAMEDRDAAVTMLKDEYDQQYQELVRNTRYKIRLAEEEHRQLSSTIRERIIQLLNHKKSRLMREKEQLDIADSNALLLHPNQFTISHSASPGGPQNNRKTRNTRHRPGEIDDIGAGSPSVGGDGNNKGKRKAAEEPEGEAHAPKHKALNGGMSTAFRDARARMAASQVEAPLYSIDQLFTEKELAMQLHSAAVAASQYFASLRAQENGVEVTEGQGNVPQARGSEDVDGVGSGRAGSVQEGEGAGDESTPAPQMSRAANASHHATRSTTSYGLSVPLIVPSSINKAGTAPPLTLLSQDQIEDDLDKMGIMNIQSQVGSR